MVFWNYVGQVRRRASRETLRVVREKAGWRLAVLGGWLIAGFLYSLSKKWPTDKQPSVEPEELLFDSAVVGVAGLILTVILVWVWNFARAPFLRDREQRDELERLRRRLDPELLRGVLRVEGPPEPLKISGGGSFLIFSLVAVNRREYPITLMVRLRLKLFSGLHVTVNAEKSPIRAWEEIREKSAGGLPAPLGIPINLDPLAGTSGYIGFLIQPSLQAMFSNRRIVNLSLTAEDCHTDQSATFWESSSSVGYLGLPDPAFDEASGSDEATPSANPRFPQ